MKETLLLIEREIPRLRRYARYLVRNFDRADDLVQDSLVRAIGAIESWRPGTNMRAWLFTIMRNVFINDIRRNKIAPVTQALDEEHPGMAVPGRQESGVELDDVERVFKSLSDEHREVLHLVAIEGLSYEEAASVLGVPVGTVRSRLSRARATLAMRLKDEPGGESA